MADEGARQRLAVYDKFLADSVAVKDWTGCLSLISYYQNSPHFSHDSQEMLSMQQRRLKRLEAKGEEAFFRAQQYLPYFLYVTFYAACLPHLDRDHVDFEKIDAAFSILGWQDDWPKFAHLTGDSAKDVEALKRLAVSIFPDDTDNVLNFADFTP